MHGTEGLCRYDQVQGLEVEMKVNAVGCVVSSKDMFQASLPAPESVTWFGNRVFAGVIDRRGSDRRWAGLPRHDWGPQRKRGGNTETHENTT